METIAIFDDLEHNRKDYDNLLMESSETNKITIILLNSYFENKKKKFIQYTLCLKKKKISFE